ncbi:hypothetical protein GGD68_007033 [Paraburkholderia fungorum]|jgi:hypothetical protein|nr:hypothetical protein [Paraburkholderia fungorum]
MGSKIDAGHAGGSMRQRRGRYSQDSASRSRIWSGKMEKSALLSKKRPTFFGWALLSEEGQLVDHVEHSALSRTARQRLLEKFG